MARARGHFPAPKRLTEWSGILLRSEVQGLAGTQSLGDSSQRAEATATNTLIRLRGTLYGHMVPDAASASMVVGCGLILASEDAFTAGAASVPSPIDDLDSPWIWNQVMVFGPSVGTEVVNEMGVNFRAEIDNKAQRRVKPNESLGFVWDSITTAGSPQFDGNVAARFLILLP